MPEQTANWLGAAPFSDAFGTQMPRPNSGPVVTDRPDWARKGFPSLAAYKRAQLMARQGIGGRPAGGPAAMPSSTTMPSVWDANAWNHMKPGEDIFAGNRMAGKFLGRQSDANSEVPFPANIGAADHLGGVGQGLGGNVGASMFGPQHMGGFGMHKGDSLLNWIGIMRPDPAGDFDGIPDGNPTASLFGRPGSPMGAPPLGGPQGFAPAMSPGIPQQRTTERPRPFDPPQGYSPSTSAASSVGSALKGMTLGGFPAGAITGRGIPPQAQAPSSSVAPTPPQFARPENRRDAFAARDLGMVADGQDMRFGPNSPASMFRGPTVRSAPGQYTVHPMMPSTGGPMPEPTPDLGTTRSQRDAGALRWASRHQSPSDGAVVTGVMDNPGADLGVRVQGFPKQPGRPNGPGYAYAPAAKIAANYNKMAAANPSLNLTPFNIGEDGGVTGADGSTPLDAGSLHSSMVQARRSERQQKIDMLRGNMRNRLAVRAAQRGNFGPLSSLMRQQGDAQGGADNGGVDHNAVFGLVGDMLKNGGDKLSVKQRSKIMQGLATAMLAGKDGASQIPALLGGIGDSIVGADWQAKARGNDVTQPLSQDQIAQYRAQFKTPQDFAAFAQSSGMNDQVRNKWLYNLYGPNADFGNDGFAGGYLPHKLSIDPNRNFQSVPQGILPGIGNWLYDSMFSRQAMGQPGNLASPFAKMFGMTAPPPVVGPAPRGGGSPPVPGAPGGVTPPQQQPLIPGRPPAPPRGGVVRPWQFQ